MGEVKSIFCRTNQSKSFTTQEYVAKHQERSLRINEYLLKVKDAMDRLASSGRVITDSDHIVNL